MIGFLSPLLKKRKLAVTLSDNVHKYQAVTLKEVFDYKSWLKPAAIVLHHLRTTYDFKIVFCEVNGQPNAAMHYRR